ncbi:hypothetical protein DPMN_051396 [Dreissena polymorpha]|uniref:Uncharacterized protein n=1 Tax=Dreissena polymorpha TaxID=45954 RepID=A0A9D4CIX2_DREPO|nr:hypothetical protein DPMN_051396 [Dreissena polymorpha]
MRTSLLDTTYSEFLRQIRIPDLSGLLRTPLKTHLHSILTSTVPISQCSAYWMRKLALLTN